MPTTSEDIIQAALKLPEPERVRIAEELIESLDPRSDEAFDEAWLAELDRRFEEFEQGRAEVVPWSEVKDIA